MEEKPSVVLCGTRAQKNLRWLRDNAPEVFQGKEPSAGWESVVLADVLTRLNRQIPNYFEGPLDVDRLSRLIFPTVDAQLKEAVFQGTIFFVRLSFTIQTPSGTVAVPAADMQTAVSYATKAAVVLADYTGQYGPTGITISQTILQHAVNLATSTYTDADLQGWVNTIKAANSLPDDGCIAILNPPGVTNSAADASQGVLGYHLKSNLPYVFVNVLGTGLTAR